VAGCALLAGYVGFQYLQKEKATEFGERYARDRGLRDASVNVQPRRLSPFNWTVFGLRRRSAPLRPRQSGARGAACLSRGDGFVAMLDSAYEPLSAARWETRTRFGEGASRGLARKRGTRARWRSTGWFADLPAYDGVSGGSTCVWFIDLRFTTPGRGTLPFRYGACRDRPDAPWRLVPP